jgi:hypothetical protein
MEECDLRVPLFGPISFVRSIAAIGRGAMSGGRALCRRTIMVVLLCLTASYPGRAATKAEGPDFYATGKELLRAVNAWRKQHHLPDFSYDEFYVHLACQVRWAARTRDVDPFLADFLKDLLHKKRFPIPVRLSEGSGEYAAMGGAYDWGDRIPLPRFCNLYIEVLHLPWGSKDAEGQDMMVGWSDILVSDVLERKVKAARKPRR